MSLRTAALLLVAPLAFVAFDQDAKKPASVSSSYHDGSYGFSLAPPAFERDDDVPGVLVAQFCAPSADGFAANLNLQRQKGPGGLADFVKTSTAQFEQWNFEVLSKHEAKVGSHDSVEWIYTGELNGRDLKFHALAVERGDEMLVLTCTALEKTFDDYAPQFKAALASFRLDN